MTVAVGLFAADRQPVLSLAAGCLWLWESASRHWNRRPLDGGCWTRREAHDTIRRRAGMPRCRWSGASRTTNTSWRPS